MIKSVFAVIALCAAVMGGCSSDAGQVNAPEQEPVAIVAEPVLTCPHVFTCATTYNNDSFMYAMVYTGSITCVYRHTPGTTQYSITTSPCNTCTPSGQPVWASTFTCNK